MHIAEVDFNIALDINNMSLVASLRSLGQYHKNRFDHGNSLTGMEATDSFKIWRYTGFIMLLYH